MGEFGRTLMAQCGRPDRADVDAFLAARYRERHVLEIFHAVAVQPFSTWSLTAATRRWTRWLPRGRGARRTWNRRPDARNRGHGRHGSAQVTIRAVASSVMPPQRAAASSGAAACDSAAMS